MPSCIPICQCSAIDKGVTAYLGGWSSDDKDGGGADRKPGGATVGGE
jgi:hypothetical protein